MNKVILLLVGILFVNCVAAVLREQFSVDGIPSKAVNAKPAELQNESSQKNMEKTGADALLESESSLLQISEKIISPLKITLRTQSLQTTGRSRWSVNEKQMEWDPSTIAFVVVDMWDNHWCPSAAERIAPLAVFINGITNAARAKGSFIIHAPSGCSNFYKDAPQRKWVLTLPDVQSPSSKPHSVPKFPVNAHEGCDVPGFFPYNAWTRQSPLINIDQNDAIIDDEKGGQTLFNVIAAKKITHLVYLGIHSNANIMNRSFALKRVVGWGIDAVVVREAVDTMYDPSSTPYVTHERSVDMMTQYIEKFWCPSVSAYDFLNPR